MGLRSRLLLLVLLPTLPALILAVYNSLGQRQLARTRVEKDAIRTVQLAAEKELGVIEATHQHLLAISRFRQDAHGTNVATFQGCISLIQPQPVLLLIGAMTSVAVLLE